MAKYINLELFKKDLIEEIDDLSALEMEDVFKYVILVKRNRRYEITRHQLNTMDDLMRLFNQAMENSGKCRFVLRFKEADNDPTFGTCSTYDVRRVGNFYETKESHTGGIDLNIIGMRRRYTFNELMIEVFSQDFLIRGIEFELQIASILYVGRSTFIEYVRSMITEMNFESMLEFSKKRQYLKKGGNNNV